MLQNKQSWKYLIGRSYKNEEFDSPFDLVIVTWKNNPNYRYAPGGGLHWLLHNLILLPILAMTTAGVCSHSSLKSPLIKPAETTLSSL